MLTRILAHDVEPTGDLEISFRPRLNLLCGDNGLGKTFVLDLAFWGIRRRPLRLLLPTRAGA